MGIIQYWKSVFKKKKEIKPMPKEVDPTRVCRSLDKLVPELKIIAQKMILDLKHHNIPAKIFETSRTIERQSYLLGLGNTKTMFSRHLEGSAFDVVIYDEKDKWTWNYEKYAYIYQMIGVIGVYKHGLEWGGNWNTFKDYPHFQLPRKKG